MKEGYSVTVSKWGKPILTIEPNMVFGAGLSDEDQRNIRDCGQHLCSLVGCDIPECVICLDDPKTCICMDEYRI